MDFCHSNSQYTIYILYINLYANGKVTPPGPWLLPPLLSSSHLRKLCEFLVGWGGGSGLGVGNELADLQARPVFTLLGSWSTATSAEKVRENSQLLYTHTH